MFPAGMTTSKGKSKKQIPFGNDNKKGKSKSKKQIPCGNDNEKGKGKGKKRKADSLRE